MARVKEFDIYGRSNMNNIYILDSNDVLRIVIAGALLGATAAIVLLTA